MTSTAVRQSEAAMTTSATPSTTPMHGDGERNGTEHAARRGTTARSMYRRRPRPTTSARPTSSATSGSRPSRAASSADTDPNAAPATAYARPRLRVRLDAHRERTTRAGRDAERRAVREQTVPELDLERRVGGEDRGSRSARHERRATASCLEPAGVSRWDGCRLIQPRSANAPKNAERPRPRSDAAQASERRERAPRR